MIPPARQTFAVPCEGEQIVATLDRAPAHTGLLIVSGGNEIAIGPQRSMARLSTLVARAGWPALRFDRRGVGDSSGTNRGFASAGPDLAAIQRAARSHGIERLVAFGNCDAAAALALLPPSDPAPDTAPIVARVLANPWLGDRSDALPSAAAIRDRYRRRLLDPGFWRALLTGRIDLRKLAPGLRRAVAPAEPAPPMLAEIASALHRHPLPTALLVSQHDATGLTFADAWTRHSDPALRATIPLTAIDTASHGFTRDQDLGQLAAILIRTLQAAA